MAAPAPRHVLFAETGSSFVEAERIEQSAIPAHHRTVLPVRRIEDRRQIVHEAVRPADILRRTASNPVHEGWTLNVWFAVANLLDDHVMAPVLAVVIDMDEPHRAAIRPPATAPCLRNTTSGAALPAGRRDAKVIG